MTMRIKWRFNGRPTKQQLQEFEGWLLKYCMENDLKGTDNTTPVDMFSVEHGNGDRSTDVGIRLGRGEAGILYLPGYFPGDAEENKLVCMSKNDRIVHRIFDRAQRVFNMEVMIERQDRGRENTESRNQPVFID
jgi:hypothetical protein